MNELDPPSPARLGELLDGIMALARLDFGRRVEVSEARDTIDAIATGLNILGEELEASTISKAYLDDILRSMGDALIVVDPGGPVRTANRSACDLLRIDERALIGTRIEAVLGETSESGLEAWRRLCASPSERAVDVSFRASDGARIPMQVHASLLLDRDDALRGWVLLARDMRPIQKLIADAQAAAAAERQRAEEVARAHGEIARVLRQLEAVSEERARLYEKAQAEVSLRDQFLATASHELRTPLSALGVTVDRLIRGAQRNLPVASGEGLRTALEAARRQVRRLARLIDELLDLTRITRGTLRLEIDAADLVDIARDVADRFGHEAQGMGSSITLVAPEAVTGRWDRLRIEQVLSNLISNALSYARGTPVNVSLWSEGDRAFCAVTDQGPGIPPADHERIFQRFERGTGATQYEGLGLGLWICRQIVQRHGGDISVSSAPGQGATFTVRLPSGSALAAEASP